MTGVTDLYELTFQSIWKRLRPLVLKTLVSSKLHISSFHKVCHTLPQEEGQRKELGMIRSALRWKTAAFVLALFLSYLCFHRSLSKTLQETLQAHIQPTNIFATWRNRTLASSRVLVYNRMPKCSSTGMIYLLKKLARANNFQVVVVEHPARGIENDLRNSTKEIELVEEVRELQNDPETSVYIRHVRSPDWLKHNLQVNLVNMVRDPIQRMMSWFYFVRYKWYFKYGKLFR